MLISSTHQAFMYCRLLEMVEFLSMLEVVPMKRFLLHLVSLHSHLIRAT